jgi:TRAP-type mannitol/chloroaromatic compound transport system permease small subunit
MLKLAAVLDALNERIGHGVAVASLALVLIQFAIVVARYVFGVGAAWAQESLVYLFAALFTLHAAATLRSDGHVRVDVFYRPASVRGKAWVDLIGSIVLLMPMCALILIVSLPYAARSFAIWEGSRQPNGIDAVFLLKGSIVAMAALVMLQGIALALKSLVTLSRRADQA